MRSTAHFVSSLAPYLLVCIALSRNDSLAHAAQPPNVVFILADDLGINDLGCYGRREHHTPRLDELARQGMRFTSAYCAQPICSASRAAIMTGRAPARLHLTTYLPGRADASSQLLLHPRIEMQLPLAETTVAERLQAAGYATACIGKWHLGGDGFGPREQGFDVYFQGKAVTMPSATEGGKGEFELTEHALRFIDARRDRPFFLYLSHNSPHIPLAAQAERVERYHDAFNPTYAAVIETLDECVGRIVDRIDALGLTERTLIVFTSDNGGLHVQEGGLSPATHNTPFRAGKGYVYEGGLRIPLIVRWTGNVPAGQVVDAPVINTDWPATLLDLAGDEIDTTADGVSLAAILTTQEPPQPRQFYWHFPHYTNQGSRPAGAVRDGDWKLIEHYEDGLCELYHLANDPAEANDLGAEQPGRVAELRGKLEAWRRDVGAQKNEANTTFNEALWRERYQDVDTSRLPTAGTWQESARGMADWRRLMDDVIRRDASAPARAGPGAVLLHARDATTHGKKLQYEAAPEKDTLGYWVDAGDWAEWQFELPAAGTYAVEVLQGCGPRSGGAEVELTVADQALRMTVEETGHFQRFVPRRVGEITLRRPGTTTLRVKALGKPGPAVMDLRRITLRGVGGAD